MMRCLAALSESEREDAFLQEIRLFPLSVRFITVLLEDEYNRWPYLSTSK